MSKKYEVKTLVQVAPQEYITVVVYTTDDLEVASDVAYEQGGYVEYMQD